MLPIVICRVREEDVTVYVAVPSGSTDLWDVYVQSDDGKTRLLLATWRCDRRVAELRLTMLCGWT